MFNEIASHTNSWCLKGQGCLLESKNALCFSISLIWVFVRQSKIGVFLAFESNKQGGVMAEVDMLLTSILAFYTSHPMANSQVSMRNVPDSFFIIVEYVMRW